MRVFDVTYNDYGRATVVAKSMSAAINAFLEVYPTYNIKSIKENWSMKVIVPGASYEWK